LSIKNSSFFDQKFQVFVDKNSSLVDQKFKFSNQFREGSCAKIRLCVFVWMSLLWKEKINANIKFHFFVRWKLVSSIPNPRKRKWQKRAGLKLDKCCFETRNPVTLRFAKKTHLPTLTNISIIWEDYVKNCKHTHP
jgi:hypothetical protein